ncbi:hypothetical protein JAAARDRAFT_43948 [Jaapia argillacea MUCL 33604]|uniref:Uncharacterized protein n=1 Tax=Jaapia argillacea MUCL 33604 TaxID=933084 RepID=A0A067QE37_9AGAM|nr:hypothetical protein JAAARDRAFT_43948 [Jaapia argillacea MUCL 33604]
MSALKLWEHLGMETSASVLVNFEAGDFTKQVNPYKHVRTSNTPRQAPRVENHDGVLMLVMEIGPHLGTGPVTGPVFTPAQYHTHHSRLERAIITHAHESIPPPTKAMPANHAAPVSTQPSSLAAGLMVGELQLKESSMSDSVDEEMEGCVAPSIGSEAAEAGEGSTPESGKGPGRLLAGMPLWGIEPKAPDFDEFRWDSRQLCLLPLPTNTTLYLHPPRNPPPGRSFPQSLPQYTVNVTPDPEYLGQCCFMAFCDTANNASLRKHILQMVLPSEATAHLENGRAVTRPVPGQIELV